MKSQRNDRVKASKRIQMDMGPSAIFWRPCVLPIAFAAVVSLCPRPVIAQRVIYVDDDATGMQTGVSWEAAYADLQDALDDARGFGGCPCEIWVAAGTYKPDRGTGDRLIHFDMISGVGVYGGFAGWETRRDQRDPEANEAILSGDLNGDDDWNLQPTSGCCFEFPEGGCEDVACREAVIERDRICDRTWDFACVNLAKELCCELCVPTFCDNSVGLVRNLNTDSTTVVDGITMTRAHSRLKPEEVPVGFFGGGPLSGRDSDIVVNDCVALENIWGGMGFLRGAPTVKNTLFLRNRVGAALSQTVSNLEVSGCRFIENEGIGLVLGDALVVRDCFFQRNGSSALILRDVSSAIGCTFIGNQASSGAGISAFGANTIGDCVFIGNRATGSGGAVSLNQGIVSNCLFVGNRAGSGGGLLDNFGSLLLNCTFVRNESDGLGAGMVSANGSTVLNSLFWRNISNDGFISERTQIWESEMDTLDINYSIVEGWTGDLGGVGNTDVDPMFVDPIGPDGIAGTVDDDLHLLPGSPAINAGDPVGFAGPPADLEGHPRTMCGRRDIGAYEFGIGDFDCDQVVDLLDFAAWEACADGPGAAPYPDDCKPFDFNTDKVIDLFDFAGFQNLIQLP